jgi:hypothetical protein
VLATHAKGKGRPFTSIALHRWESDGGALQ